MSNLSERQFAAHIIEHYAPNDRLAKDSGPEDVWARKLEKTKSRDPYNLMVIREGDAFRQVSLHEHIGAKGVSKPVTLQHPDAVAPGERPHVFDGHHRIAAAADHGLDVPVQYADTMDEARKMRPR